MISVQEQNFYRNIRDISKSLESIAKSLKDLDEMAHRMTEAAEQLTATERSFNDELDEWAMNMLKEEE